MLIQNKNKIIFQELDYYQKKQKQLLRIMKNYGTNHVFWNKKL